MSKMENNNNNNFSTNTTTEQRRSSTPNIPPPPPLPPGQPLPPEPYLKSENGETLILAEIDDFYPASQIFVRGRLATCTRIDFPHVYWHWINPKHPDDETEKHRSFTASSHMFAVDPNNPRSRAMSTEGSATTHTQQINGELSHNQLHHDDDDEEEDDDEHDPGQHIQILSDDSNNHNNNNNNTNTETRNNLVSMFSRRPSKQMWVDLHDTNEITETRFPQSVYVENCTNSQFHIPNKVSSITLLNCTNINISFSSVISNVETIKCKDCIISCSDSCDTYTCDDTINTQFQFPSVNQSVMWITTNTKNIKLCAKTFDLQSNVSHHVNQSDDEPNVKSDQMFDIIENHDNTTSDNGQQNNSMQLSQFRTTYRNGVFQTSPLERDGVFGYFLNN